MFLREPNTIVISCVTAIHPWVASMVPKNLPTKADKRITQQHQVRKMQAQLSRCKR
jgi:hypothetical protein